MRAAPAVSFATCTSRCAHEHTGQRRTSDIPCAMALRLIRTLPGELRSVATVACERVRKLGASLAAPGPHDFAVRFDTARQHVLKTAHGVYPPCNPFPRTMPPRPPHPIPTFGDDGQRPFLRGQDSGSLNGDLGFGKREILPDGLICRRGRQQETPNHKTRVAGGRSLWCA